MHPEEKRDWQIFAGPLCYTFGFYIIMYIVLSLIPTDSFGSMGALGIPVMTWLCVFLPFAISCVAPVIISWLCVRAMPEEDAKN
ncbi:hypothetical protein [Candidatus Formimonas warabiya]|uniref:DUF997 family protein n=1 Tax=Formimonas warabiya TaxID=1761012 RepID=A0A3G1L085_FORW1|nr:hypothetical protein [Candidatus Formimonas warabiya]ATW28067.1 hypothetical protein DCMF_27910 [Candidatus Formimonas warabiya]